VASSFERKYNSEPGAQFELGSVKCYMTGAHTAWCWGRLTAGRYHGQDVTISQDGNRWNTTADSGRSWD
jgi:hypothetical protein